MMDDDRRDELIGLIRDRCPEISDDELAELTAPAEDALPIEGADQVVELIDMLEKRLTRLEERQPWVQ